MWVEYVRNRSSIPEVRERYPEFVTCGPVLQEIFQGLDQGPRAAEFRATMLEIPRIADPVPLEIFLQAAEIYGEGRRRGYTIRSTVDCLIAAVAIDNNATVWHRDRDFTTIARYTPLREISRYLT